MSFILAFLGFVALIILHEGGHFAAAKAVGMRVERFSLFFGPMFVKARWGETEYGIGPIPLGGYVKISGMNPTEKLPPEVVPRAYYNQPVWKRIVVILAGPAVNLVIAFVIIWALFLGGSLGRDVVTHRVQATLPGSPAAGVLRTGDRILSVDGSAGTPQAIRAAISRHRCAGTLTSGCVAATPARVTVQRANRLRTVPLRPRYNADQKEMLIGIDFGVRTEPLGFGRSTTITAQALWSVTKQTVSRIARIFQPQARRQLHSVVGAYTITQKRFAANTTLALETLALISLSLTIINLFPFLPLDGGHVFWALAEKLRGRRIPFGVMERAGFVGFALILLLFLIGLSNDITGLGNGSFNVH